VPAFTLLSAYAAWSLTNALELGAGIDNLGNLSLVDKSPLYVQGIAPRTFRVSLNARW
jgi:outer membrane receptor for ferrienterochelin and colicins